MRKQVEDEMMLFFPSSGSGWVHSVSSTLTQPHCLNVALYTSHKALEAAGQRVTALRFLSAHFNVVLILWPTAGQLTVSGFV